MTRTYALRKLLEHGPLTLAQLVEITGWAYRHVTGALNWLMQIGVVEREHDAEQRFQLYRLAGDAPPGVLHESLKAVN